jgi:hypothetical protein
VSRLFAGLTDTEVYRDAVEIGQTAGALATLGGAAGLVAAALVETFWPERRVSHTGWAGRSAAFLAFAGICVEILSRLGIR